MSYRLQFLPSALKEWKKLDKSLQRQLKKKLADVLLNPHIVANKLRGFETVYKIKLRASGYRLVYEVNDKEIVVLIIVIGKRNQAHIYKTAQQRLDP